MRVITSRVKAYILIEMTAGHSRDLVNALMGEEQLREVDRVTGPYDVIAVLEARDLNEISAIVRGKIHPLPGVVRTNTCVSLE